MFVLVVGLAAWIHSLWSFSVIIGGDAPVIATWQDVARWLYWALPGMAAAAAVDIGLISLAAQFRNGHGNRAKLVTFGVLSLISYLGQALFALSHGGKYVPSSGLSAFSVSVASVVWELLIWTLPAALPVVLVLWAWSDSQKAAPVQTTETALVTTNAPLTVELPEREKAGPAPTSEGLDGAVFVAEGMTESEAVERPFLAQRRSGNHRQK